MGVWKESKLNVYVEFYYISEECYMNNDMTGSFKSWRNSEIYAIGFCINGIKEGEEIMYGY